jgi:stage IV sporulation protein FA
MDSELWKVKKNIKDKRKNATTVVKKTPASTSIVLTKYINRFFITVILMLITLISLKSNVNLKTTFYKHVFDTNISFASINKIYKDYFGSPIPFQNLFKDKIEPVFNEKLNYTEANKYKDGVKLVVDQNYLVPILESGIVIFIGEKEGYGKTVIIQQTNGIDLWYSNIDKLNVKLYDFIEKGKLLGECIDTNLYLVYVKEGKVLDYKEYIK